MLLAHLPLLLEQIVTSSLGRLGDIRIERCTDAQGDLLKAARRADARIVVVACRDPGDLNTIDPGLATASGLAVLALTHDGSSACLHTVESTARCLGDVSPDGMLAALMPVLPPSGRG